MSFDILPPVLLKVQKELRAREIQLILNGKTRKKKGRSFTKKEGN
jgi:hypothetical protein